VSSGPQCPGLFTATASKKKCHRKRFLKRLSENYPKRLSVIISARPSLFCGRQTKMKIYHGKSTITNWRDGISGTQAILKVRHRRKSRMCYLCDRCAECDHKVRYKDRRRTKAHKIQATGNLVCGPRFCYAWTVA
jgi:hypothetical protein